MSKAPEKVKKYEDRLTHVFDFDEDDLEANEAGHLSRRQIAHLKAARNRAVSTFALLAMLFGFLAIFVVAAGFQTSNILPPLVAGFLTVLVMYGISGTKAGSILRDLSENQAAMTEGRVDLLLNDAQYGSEYFLRVENVRFTVKQDAFLAFKNGDPYRVYYAPRSKRILSVEWLREDDNLLDEGERRARLQDASETAPFEAQEDQSSISTTNTA